MRSGLRSSLTACIALVGVFTLGACGVSSAGNSKVPAKNMREFTIPSGGTVQVYCLGSDKVYKYGGSRGSFQIIENHPECK